MTPNEATARALEALERLGFRPAPYNYDASDALDDVAIVREVLASAEAEVAALKEANRWISVEERLPEESVKVIATNGKWVDLCVMSNRTWYFHPTGDYELNVIAWMPLPAPPNPAAPAEGEGCDV